MDEDIDIEEHNVLDNPAIKSIFPDLSLLKQEIEENETTIFDYHLQEDCQNKPKELNLKESIMDEVPTNHIKNEISVQINEVMSVNDSTSSGKEIVLSNCNENLFFKKIILGTKQSSQNLVQPRSNENQNQVFRSQICLKDISSYLDSNVNYCKSCMILFPDNIAIESHILTYHPNIEVAPYKFSSQKHNIDSTKATNQEKTTQLNGKSKDSIKTTINNLMKDSDTKKKCFHCKKVFSSHHSLIEHLYTILETNKTLPSEKDKNVKQKLKTNNHTNNISNKGSNKQSYLLYNCPICFFYYKDSINYDSHMKKKHNITNYSQKRVPFVSKCKLCNHRFITTKSYNAHMKYLHVDQKLENPTNPRPIQIPNKNENQNVKKDINKQIKLFRCHICSYYIEQVKFYTIHMYVKHNINIKKIPNKEYFENDCCYCDYTCNSFQQFNVHINKQHKSKLFEKAKKYPTSIKTNDCVIDKQLILKSTLFKCCKCDVHFTKAKDAKSHLNHLEILINWKCSICQRIFKNNDEETHKKQHFFNDNFNVIDIIDCDQALLYNCIKCAVNFDEDNILSHYKSCEDSPPSSLYCKICDILIDANIYSAHTEYHSKENMQSNDFTIVDSELIETFQNDIKDLNKKTPSKVKHIPGPSKIKKYLTELKYCKTCKCFITKYHNTVHLKSACKHLVKYVCRKCGLLLTAKLFKSHQKIHTINKNFKLQDFSFFDIQSGKQICPPLPSYPKCKICQVHFITKVASKTHICSENDYLSCNICESKFSEAAYKLHMDFHNYSFNDPDTRKESSDTKNINPKSPQDNIVTEKQIENVNNENSHKNYNKTLDLLYTCKNCSTSIISYDKVVEHCQKHYAYREFPKDTILCGSCNLKFDQYCYDAHKAKGKCKLLDNGGTTILKFDIFYFPSDNNIWISHVFKNVNKEKIKEVLNKSIYNSEHRIKFDITQEGHNNDWTVYKCDKCRCFMNTKSVFSHFDSLCNFMKKYPCHSCGIPFISLEDQKQHMDIHNVPNISLNSYRIVNFNREADKEYNYATLRNLYVSYQCRLCLVVVSKTEINEHICKKKNLKKCSICGLLFGSRDFSCHTIKHKEFKSFSSSNMKIILFGKNIDGNFKADFKFKGEICNYVLYICTKCNVCYENVPESHQCLPNLKTMCKSCDLYLDPLICENHQNEHKSNPYYIKECINLIPFGENVEKRLVDAQPNLIENQQFSKVKNESHDKNNDVVKSDENFNDNKQNLDKNIVSIHVWKCNCGLHFFDKLLLYEHFELCGKVFISKQNCPKCSMTFTPVVLFNHLIEHHGNTTSSEYKFDVENIPKRCLLFKCFLCHLHFSKSKDAMKHIEKCLIDDIKSNSYECGICHLQIDQSSEKRHKKDHESGFKIETIQLDNAETEVKEIQLVRNITIESDDVFKSSYNISRKFLDKIDIGKFGNSVFLCRECDVHYICKDTLRRHIQIGIHNKITSPQNRCDVCGLNFSLPTLTKHKYIHHEQLKLDNVNVKNYESDEEQT